tara:strand:+ start:690 stop:887 length:198 start_codon:yes stop_codon:yes gene_type:complete
MRDQRLEQTIQRIERALARIGAAADASVARRAEAAGDSSERYEEMRNKVRAELDRLDSVIEELEK